MAYHNKLEVSRAGEAWGQRMVMVVGKYEDGTEFAEMFPENQAEIFVQLMAWGLSPVELEDRLAGYDIEITDKTKDLRSKRVVSAIIKYSEAEPVRRSLSEEDAKTLNAAAPDYDIDPRYDRRKPMN